MRSFIKKYKKYTFMLSCILMLYGCSETPAQNQISFGIFVKPLVFTINFLADYLNSYGMSIILLTLLIRLILMPLMLNNIKKQRKMQQVMINIKPELDLFQQKIKTANTNKERIEYQQQMALLYKKNNISISNLGCLSFIIQAPILMALYYAIRYDQTISSQTFFWFNLGKSDLIIAFIAAALYYIQYKLSLSGMDEKQKKKMKFIGIISPLMIFVFSINNAAALPLYWATSAIFLIFQQYVSRKLYSSIN